MRYRITPGSMSAALLAFDIFGHDRVDVGNFLTPVYVNDVKPEEVESATKLLADKGLKFQGDR